MNAEAIFSAATWFAMAGWFLLVFLPRWKWTDRLVLSGGFSLVLAAGYLTLIVLFIRSGEGGFDSLARVGMLFQQQFLLLAGWIHYLAFDLFVGSWEVRDARHRGVPHLFVVPCLFLTFMLGPVGLLAYYGLRSFWRGQGLKTDA